jgi:hypothetical protein
MVPYFVLEIIMDRGKISIVSQMGYQMSLVYIQASTPSQRYDLMEQLARGVGSLMHR